MNGRLVTPFLGVAAYVWLLTAAALDGSAHRAIRQSGLLDLVGLVVAIWTAFDFWRHRRPGQRPGPSHPLGWSLLALCVWVLLCAAAAALRGQFGPATEYRTVQFALAAVIFFATTNGFAHRWHLAVLSLPLAAIVLSEAAAELDSLALDQNVAAAAALTVPALAGAAQSAAAVVSWVAVCAAFALGGVTALTRNRGGGLALLVVTLALAWQSRRRWAWLFLMAATLAAAAWTLSGTGYFSRYRDIWTGGPAYDTVQDRLDLWADAWRLAVARPVVGVGPGNYGAVFGGRDPHSHVMAMLSETGFPGALLYATFFGAALIVAMSRLRRSPLAAGTSVAGVAGFLVVGFFLGLQTHALAFMYAGLAQAAARDPSDSAQAEG